MPAPRLPRICLNMIVKNETAVLGRLFASVSPYIDYYVIVDTGSTDGTQEFIRDWMADAGIPGEIHERPWVNFGHNRQQALELAVAADQGDWLLIIDADEELGVADPLFREKLEPGVTYSIEKHHDSIRYAVPHLLDIRRNRWRWKGPVHEYLEHVEGEQRNEVRHDVWIVYHSGEGVRSRGLTSEQKYLRDARILEKELKARPDDARSQFYLGQSYRHAGKLAQALEAYRRRAAMEGWEEERFMAQLEVGRVSALLGKDDDLVLQELMKAWEMRPTRAEPLHELARHFRQRKKYGRAWIYAKAGLAVPCPSDRLFVDFEVYSWRLLDELAVSAYWIGRFQESRDAGQAILDRVAEGLVVGRDDLNRIHQNIAYANVKLED